MLLMRLAYSFTYWRRWLPMSFTYPVFPETIIVTILHLNKKWSAIIIFHKILVKIYLIWVDFTVFKTFSIVDLDSAWVWANEILDKRESFHRQTIK